MIRTLAFLFLLLSIGCNTAYQSSNQTNTAIKNDGLKIMEVPKIFDSSFGLNLQMEQLNADEYNLTATILLDHESYIISPFSTDDFYLPFTISIKENSYFTSDDSLLEIPQSLPEIDTILNKPVNFVRENTTYKQKIKVTTKEDFEVAGLIEFLLEPSCIPYDIEFVMSYQSGKMNVKKTKTFISKEYKM